MAVVLVGIDYAFDCIALISAPRTLVTREIMNTPCTIDLGMIKGTIANFEVELKDVELPIKSESLQVPFEMPVINEPKYLFGMKRNVGWIWSRQLGEYIQIVKYTIEQISLKLTNKIIKLRRRFYASGFCSENRGLHWDRKRI
ncbi:MAG: hypothetical protein A2Y12_08800 [Planctomycetes bacterium GWF2_42_9]|nr:MAG: hypothetical protein A2Y12_08800 [Planctomycetes bacterium GWF2_42_9]HAL45496.1 hypothetical protein [Phycisphaerales bacterium]